MANTESTFNNPAGAAAGHAEAYIRALLELLGDRDPWAVQESLVDRLREATAGLSEESLRRREAPGKWSVMEVIGHLADSEWVAGYRYRATLAEDGPDLAGYDQDLWVRGLGSHRASLEPTLGRLRMLRQWNLELLRTLSAEDWQRIGHHSERGEESVDQLFRLLAAHDLVHLRQIERIRKTLGE